jgi:hypothetical protein
LHNPKWHGKKSDFGELNGWVNNTFPSAKFYFYEYDINVPAKFMVDEKANFIWVMAWLEFMSVDPLGAMADVILNPENWKRPLAEYEALYDKYVKEISEARTN